MAAVQLDLDNQLWNSGVLPAGRAAAFLYLVPLLATLIAWLWLGEWPDVQILGGGLLALLGVMMVQRGGRKRAPAAIRS